jgi:hypothetical protein
MSFLHKIARIAALFALAGLLAAAAGTGKARAGQDTLTIYLFWQQGCPYCAGARAELETLAETDRRIELRAIELAVDAGADALFGKALAHFEYEQAAVPLVVIGDRPFLGFLAGGGSAGLYRQAIDYCLSETCTDVIAALAGDRVGALAGGGSRRLLPEVIDLPVIGAIQPQDLSLPALTVLLAAIDGFNPCAMWVLVFLIGLLLGLKDEKRMWLLGGAFLLATAIMYFAVMAAWLNLILLLGTVVWVRLAIGALAIGGGIWFLRDYWTNPDAACQVTDSGRRQKIMAAFRSVVNNNQLVLSVAGIMALAVLVNFVELLCSAGIPAVYTQVLVLGNHSAAAHYLYLGLYIAVFMLDDIAIFATAMFALRVSGLTGGYARFSHLIGGIVLLAIGAILLLRPDLLSFG